MNLDGDNDNDNNLCDDDRKPPARVSDVSLEQKVEFDIESISVRNTFHQSKHSSRSLLTMAIGCVFEGKALYNMNKFPFVGAANKNTFKPNKSSLIDEVNRRYMIKNNGRKKKCRSHTAEQLIKYLEDHPITYLNDVQYMQRHIELLSIQLEARQTVETGPAVIGTWNSYKHYLRLYHCLMDDDIRKQYMKRDKAMSREQLDGMRSPDMHETTVYENIAMLYNDENFNPTSLDLREEHSMFAKQVPLLYSSSPVPTTGEKVKQRLADCRCKMMIVCINSYIYIILF
jgi:hypothetical protein